MKEVLYIVIALSSAASSAANTSNCCNLLLHSPFAEQISLPNSSIYDTTIASYWSLQESNLSPSCIAKPKQAADVAGIISILTNKGQSQRNCPFAIKGHTHAPAAGFANINNGVTIDLTSLNDISFQPDSGIAGIGGGASWLDVYRFLNSTSRTVAGGRNGQVGVGGLLTGGGISHFTTRVGFACDTVRNFEVVLASGQLVNANATHHTDLFQALKGGGNNFGVVTRFDMITFPQGPLSITSLTNDISQRTALFQAFSDITNSRPFDEDVSLVMSLLFNGTSKKWTSSTSAVYTNTSKQETVFAELTSIPSISKTTKTEWLADYANEAATPPLNWQFRTGTYAVSSTLMSDMFDILNETFTSFSVAGGVTWSVTFEPLPTVIVDKSRQGGQNALGLNTSDGNAFIMLLSALWPDSAKNDAVQNINRQVGTEINNLARSRGKLHNFTYLNYADPNQSPIQSYGKTSVAQLQAVSKKYDHHQVFQNQVPGGFKLYQVTP